MYASAGLSLSVPGRARQVLSRDYESNDTNGIEFVAAGCQPAYRRIGKLRRSRLARYVSYVRSGARWIFCATSTTRSNLRFEIRGQVMRAQYMYCATLHYGPNYSEIICTHNKSKRDNTFSVREKTTKQTLPALSHSELQITKIKSTRCNACGALRCFCHFPGFRGTKGPRRVVLSRGIMRSAVGLWGVLGVAVSVI